MKSHANIAAALHLALGLLCFLASLVIWIFMGLAGGLVMMQGEMQAAGILGVIAVAVAAFLTILSLPGIVGGWAYLAGCSWARPVLFVLGALQLLNFPFGTALGVYTFWALQRASSER